MLHIVRKHAQSWVTKGILAIIVFVFVFWGVEAVVSGVNPQTTAAVVDGAPIETIAVARAEFNLRRAYERQLGDQMTDDLLKALGLQDRALEGLIERRLLSNRAQALGFDISDQEVRDIVVANPAFYSGGRFDKDAYIRVLRGSRLTPAEFESSLREDLVIDRLQSAIGDEVSVSQDEARLEFMAREEKVKLAFVRFPAGDFTEAVEVTPEALAAFYEEAGERYREPEKVTIQLLAYRAGDFMDGVAVSEEEIGVSYEAGKETRFTEEYQVKARHILKRIAPDADDETKASARAALVALAEQIEAGADFADLARDASDDPGSAVQGGDLGFFGKGRMVASFEEAAFALASGELSAVIESPFGFHLIQVQEVRPERVQELDEVRETITSELRVAAAGDAAKTAAEEDRASIEGGTAIAAVAEARGLVLEEAGPLARSDSLPGIGRSFPLLNALFGLSVGGVTDAIDVNGTIVVAILEAKIPAAIPEIATVESRVEVDFRRAQAGPLAEAAAAAFLEAARSSADLASAAEADGRALDESPLFARRGGAVPGIGAADDLKNVAFGLSAEAPLAERTFLVGSDAYVVALAERQLPDADDLEAQIEETRTSMTNQRRSEVLQRYIRELRLAASIEIYKNNLDRAGAQL
ncbi:MAG: SurA N-terminal domain-containing protein [Deltaproteobacteria bacterium]